MAEGGEGCVPRGRGIPQLESTHTMFALSHLTLEELSLHTLEWWRMCVCVCALPLSVCLSRCLYLSFPFFLSLSFCLSRSECVQAAHLHINSVKNYD